ncbi:TPA: hypothetical protein DEP90_01650 [Patescibacteria group bacterium]|nr:hypothetical protein [Patescibacteria group bacterium]
MAATEKKIADLVAFTTPADGDLLASVDVSDTAQSDDGSTKKITRANFLGTLFSIAADTGTDLDILPAETFSILGGTGIASVASATRKITLSIDATVATLTGTQILTNKTINGDDNTLSNIAYDSIKSTSRTGSDVKLVTGTKGSAYEDSVWDGNGDLVGLVSLVGTGDGVTDDTATLNAFLTANAGNSVRIPAGDYLVTGTIAIPANTTVYAYGAKVFDTVTERTLVTMTSGSKLFGLEIEGTGNNSTEIIARAISIIGADKDNYIQDVIIRDCYFHDMDFYGIYMEFAQDIHITHCRFYSIGYAGVLGKSLRQVHVSNCWIKSITPGSSGNAYGVAFTRQAQDSDLVTYPVSRDCSVTSCVIEDIKVWEALDCHAGINMEFSNNIIKDCRTGIALNHATGDGGIDYSGPRNCTVSGNVVSLSEANGMGISVQGTAGTYAHGVSITGNTIYEGGVDDNNISGGIKISYTENAVISGNSVFQPYSSGIMLYIQNKNFAVIGNAIYDVQTTTDATPTCIWVKSEYNTGVISGNSFVRDDTTINTYVSIRGIRVSTLTNVSVKIGQNFNSCSTYLSGIGGWETLSDQMDIKCRAYLSADQANLTHDVATKVLLDEEDYDLGADFSSYKFTVPVTGYYYVMGRVTFFNLIADSTYYMYIYVDGSAAVDSRGGNGGATNRLTVSDSDILYLTAGEEVELYAVADTAGDEDTVDIDNGAAGNPGDRTCLTIHLISL